MAAQAHSVTVYRRLGYFIVKTKPVTLIGKSTKRADGTIPTSSHSSVTHNIESTQQRFASINTPQHWDMSYWLTISRQCDFWRDRTALTACLCHLSCSSCHQPWLCLHQGALARHLSPEPLQTWNHLSSVVVLIFQHSNTWSYLVTSIYRPLWPTVREEH